MKIAQILAGYSLGEADLLRRAMGKKKKEEMDQQRARFLGRRRPNVRASTEDAALDMFEKHGEVRRLRLQQVPRRALRPDFSYQTAWLKANAPVEFFAASMSLDLSNTDKLAVFYQDAKRQKPCRSRRRISTVPAPTSRCADGKVLYALGAVRNVGRQAMEHVVDVRRVRGRLHRHRRLRRAH